MSAKIYFDGDYNQFLADATKEGCKWIASHAVTKSSFESKGYEKAKELSLFGDVEKAKKYRGKVIDIANFVTKEYPRMDVEYVPDEGSYIDIARYTEGIPECIGKFVENNTKQTKRCVDIGVNLCFGFNVHENDINAYCAKLTGITIGLIASNIQVNVTLYYAIGGTNEYRENISYVFIKLPSDFAKISSAFSSYFFRRIYFAWAEQQNEKYKESFEVAEHKGYGRCIYDPCSIRKFDVDLYDSWSAMKYTEKELLKKIQKAIESKNNK